MDALHMAGWRRENGPLKAVKRDSFALSLGGRSPIRQSDGLYFFPGLGFVTVFLLAEVSARRN